MTKDDYYKIISDKQKELDEAFDNYPVFNEKLKSIEKYELKTINEYVTIGDTYSLKRAISLTDDLIKDIISTSLGIDECYKEYDSLSKEWSKINELNCSQEEVDKINDRLHECNKLIQSHQLYDLKDACSRLKDLIKEAKRYQK